MKPNEGSPVGTSWCVACGGLVCLLDDGSTGHVCLPETADGFTLAGTFYRYMRDTHLWVQMVVLNSERTWVPANLPPDVLVEVAHLRQQVIT